jgi:hypothetical protein
LRVPVPVLLGLLREGRLVNWVRSRSAQNTVRP